MEILDNVLMGFATALTPMNLFYAFVGVFIGNLIGVLPGVGALAALSMLLPVTYGLEPAAALMMLAGLYYGTSYGGGITSVLLNLPGTATHAVVCLDGNPMARKGQAGAALFAVMLASFLGATVGIVLIKFFSPILLQVAFHFGPAEYFALMLLGLLAASTLTSGSPIKGIAMVLVGLIAGVVGTDVNTGAMRFTLGMPSLQEGISLVALAMGLFGVSDVLSSAGVLGKSSSLIDNKISMRSMLKGRSQMKGTAGAIGRGSAIGSFFGLLPGTGGTLASFISYATEKKLSKTPEKFGKGAIQGLAGPESANSSAAITAFIPTLTLGIPGDAVMAIMLGALMIHNIQPGPQLMIEHQDIFWGLIASFWIGNLLLVVLNMPLIRFWVRLLTIPYRLIFPAVMFFICIGVFSASNNLFDVWVVLLVGIFGYIIVKLGFEPAPMLLAFVLGPLMEENFRRALLMSRGDMAVFVTRPISGFCMAINALLILLVMYSVYKKHKQRKLALAAA